MQAVHRSVATPLGPRRVLVVAPAQNAELNRAALTDMQAGAWSCGCKTWLDQVRCDSEPTDAVVLRARDFDGDAQFRTCRALTESELHEVGYWLAVAQFRAWRQLRDAGVRVLARVELRVRELSAMRAGTSRLFRELPQATPNSERVELQRALLSYGVGLETALSELLPHRLCELESDQPASLRQPGITIASHGQLASTACELPS